MKNAKFLASSALALSLLTPGTAGQAGETRTYTYDARGRLVAVDVNGGPADGQSAAYAYDDAGNRTNVTATGGASPPTPTPTPTNSPPTAVADVVSVLCGATTTANLVANDSDPENNTPLSLVSIVLSGGSGFSGASIASSTSVSIHGDFEHSTTIYTYTVQDSLGATSTGTLTINAVGPPSKCF